MDAYSPVDLEKQIQEFWKTLSFENTPSHEKDSFCVLMPPPNVTGILHIGHVLNNTIQDVFVRIARQDGKNVLWIPGTDHAGIATQTRVEKDLLKQGLNRLDLGREKFVEKAVEWRDKHGNIIFEQLKSLGVSCDWNRSVHTLDSDYSFAVLHSFVELYKQGHIYRGKRLVNWCPASLTALSDEEVVMKEQTDFLYYVKYEIVENPGQFLTIATTRPETIMGDSAICVNPEDERYKHLIGKHCFRPFPKEPIPIISDNYVEKDFGTGVLKITPAHDKADFELGLKHNLKIIDIFNPNGTLNSLAGQEFDKMDRFEARKVVVQKLKDLGILEKMESYTHSVGYSERMDVQIEPRLSKQWFLKYPMVEEAKEVVKNGLIKFWPAHWVKTYLHWLDNIQDWCISRQLWWGHQIPVWYRKNSGASENLTSQSGDTSVSGASENMNSQSGDTSVSGASENLTSESGYTSVSGANASSFGASENLTSQSGYTSVSGANASSSAANASVSGVYDNRNDIHVSVSGPTDVENWEQDEDVLDTWFSSWLWPFGTFGWPNENEMTKNYFEKYFPTNLLVTGPDILFFWVTRMILASLKFMGKNKEGNESLSEEQLKACIPFENVYLTGIIRDSLGRKMSKSLGNSPDPVDLIKTYGADGLRWGLLSIAPAGQDILFSEDKIAYGRNFCNKLWNACRLRKTLGKKEENSSKISNLSSSQYLKEIEKSIVIDKLSVYDCDILLKLNELFDNCSNLLKEFELCKNIQLIESFFWNDFCDWHLEVCKTQLSIESTDEKLSNILKIQDLCLRQILIMCHPVIPAITEFLWHELNFGSKNETIQLAKWAEGINVSKNIISKAFSEENREKNGSIDVLFKNRELVSDLRELISKGRALKAKTNSASKKGGRFLCALKTSEESFLKAFFETERVIIANLLRVDDFEITREQLPNLSSEVIKFGILFFEQAKLDDFSNPFLKQAEIEKLKTDLKNIERFVSNQESKLNDQTFLSKAPEFVIQGTKKQLEDNLTKKQQLIELIDKTMNSMV